MSRTKRTLLVLTIIALSPLFAYERIHQRPQEFSAVDLNGTPVDLESLRGNVVVVTYWLVSCYPCRIEVPFVDNLQKKWAGRPVKFFALNPFNSLAENKQFRDGANPSGKPLTNVTFLTNGEDTHEYGLLPAMQEGVVMDILTPTTVVIDKDGYIAAREGAMGADLDRLVQDLVGTGGDDQPTVKIRSLPDYKAPGPNAKIRARSRGRR